MIDAMSLLTIIALIYVFYTAPKQNRDRFGVLWVFLIFLNIGILLGKYVFK
jgi:hypothetical protein